MCNLWIGIYKYHVVIIKGGDIWFRYMYVLGCLNTFSYSLRIYCVTHISYWFWSCAPCSHFSVHCVYSNLLCYIKYFVHNICANLRFWCITLFLSCCLPQWGSHNHHCHSPMHQPCIWKCQQTYKFLHMWYTGLAHSHRHKHKNISVHSSGILIQSLALI
jgi:hypothetical protein